MQQQNTIDANHNYFATSIYEAADKECKERILLGLPDMLVFDFTRDLALMARGGKPKWGDDLIDDIHELPPFLLRDLCPEDGSISVVGLRYLVQRIFSVENCLSSCLFASAQELDMWKDRLGPLDVPRRGIYKLPWIYYPEESKPRSDMPGRNDPCPCGSGKKFKKCCITKTEKVR
jgi:hypothetical protein